MTVTLYAYQYSVYAWIARLVLAEKAVGHDYVEVNPFASDMPTDYLVLHPFRRVPTLVHDDFVLYETTAITRYVDETFPGPALQPVTARERARMTQIIAVIDAYGYWPMVRQVYSHSVFRPGTGQPVDDHQISAGLLASERALGALETLAADAPYLINDRVSLADLHLAPMMSYFAAAEAGSTVLARHPKLSRWWTLLRPRPGFIDTTPPFP